MKAKTKQTSLRKKLVSFLIEFDISDTDLIIIDGRSGKTLAGIDRKTNITECMTIDTLGKEYLTQSVINRMIFRMVKGLYPTQKEIYLMRVAYFKAIHKWIQKRRGIENVYPRLIRMLSFWEFISDHSLNEKEAQDLFFSLRYGISPIYDHERLGGYGKLIETWRDNLWMQI